MNDDETRAFLARLMTAEEFYGRQQWKRNMTNITQETVIMAQKQQQPLATVPANSTKAERAAAIAEAAAKKKVEAKPVAKKTPPKTPPAKEAKKVENDDMLSVSDVAKELGIDPKRARARLRASGQGAQDGRYPKVKRGSKEHDALVAAMSPDDEPTEEADDDDEE